MQTILSAISALSDEWIACLMCCSMLIAVTLHFFSVNAQHQFRSKLWSRENYPHDYHYEQHYFWTPVKAWWTIALLLNIACFFFYCAFFALAGFIAWRLM